MVPDFTTLADTVLRASVPLLCAAFLALACTRRAAALRHKAWALGVFGALAIPALAWAAPLWRLALLPAPAVVATPDGHGRATERSVREPVQPLLSTSPTTALGDVRQLEPERTGAGGPSMRAPLGQENRTVDELGDARAAAFARTDTAGAHAGAPTSLDGADRALPSAAPRTTTASGPEREARSSTTASETAATWFASALEQLRLPSGPTGVLAAWLCGAVLGLLWLAAGLLRIRWLLATARPCTDVALLDVAREVGGRLGAGARVRVCTSELVGTPMTFGHWKPVVLLPESALAWSRERSEIVLAHELSHIRRGDWATQVLAQVARAVYWFHPLVWLAFRRLSVERERACDEAVVALGTPPSLYAEHLLELAVGANRRRLGHASLAMAHPSQLEGRLMSILENEPRRGHALLAPLTLAMIATTGACVAARTFPAASKGQVEPTTTPVAQSAPGAQGHKRAEASYLMLHTGSGTTRISGRVFDGQDVEPTATPLWRNDEGVRSAFAAARPTLEELEPFERELDALHAEMQPFQDEIDRIHAEMEPLHEAQEELHERMEPFHEEIEHIHERIEPEQERIEQVHEEMEHVHARQEALHERLEPYHERIDQIHGEMERVHRRQDELHEQLEPFHDRTDELHERIDELHERIERLDPTREAAKIRPLTVEIEELAQRIEDVHEQMRPIQTELERVHEELEPFHRRIEQVHKEMEPLHAQMQHVHEELEPFHERIGHLHEEMEPAHEELEAVHHRMEPLHEELERMHEELEPFHRRIEQWHQEIEPFHKRMEPIHKRMEPLWERLEPTWERLNEALELDLGRLWHESVERASGLEDADARARLSALAPLLLERISWGWSVARDPWELTIRAGQRSLAGELERALEAVSEGGPALDATERAAARAVIADFAATLRRLRYRV